MIELPEGVSAILTAKCEDGSIDRSQKISQSVFLNNVIKEVQRFWPEIRIYLIDSKIKYTHVTTEEAWDNGRTLEELEEYLND
ncbi:Hypothetical protein KNT65_gp063 [Escherichia phage EcS1]|uniref:Uncharacterized protein n=1 Tax=Escherichia phage EcS1 TaxID=2083276 RepID=A0A2Z5ZCE9_9CAUD|nr:Hypothetical protein KNT65_gp063 [Escherichia phage EcS1]BBC78111.1 Hypothetical protein [Escherichia phage EcS1]